MIADAEEDRDQRRAEDGHDEERGIHVGVGSPSLRPLQVPAETRLHAEQFGDDEHRDRSAEPHEEADEHMRQRGRDGDAQHQKSR